MLTIFSNKNSGFTIIEVLVMIAIVLILAALVLPQFLTVEDKVQEIKIAENMRTVQHAVDDYAAHNNGLYPVQAKDAGFKSFFPGGNCDSKNPQGGKYPENPYTHIAEPPVYGNITDVAQTRACTYMSLGDARLAGKIFYNAIVPTEGGNPIGYAIVGANKDGKALPGKRPNTVYVLSNLQ